MKRSILVLAAVILFGLASQVLPARATTTVVVSPSNMQNWQFAEENPTGATGMVLGPATPPAGNGSAHMTIADASGRELLVNPDYAGTHFSDITQLSYSTYQAVASPGVFAISLQFDVDYDLTDLNNAFQGRLIFEPYYTNTIQKGVWQTWNPLAGVWWASNPIGAAFCPINAPCTWAQVLTHFPNAGIRNADILMFKAGAPWTGFDGNVDNFTIGTTSGTTTFDFEAPVPCTTDCYVRTDGSDLNGGSANTAAEAKKTIQAAVNAVSATGTVHVAAGTYAENVTVPKALTIEGAGQGSTIVVPAVSNPNACFGNATCGGNASNVFLVQANDVAIHDLTVDGNNTSLSSGFSSNGVDVDARNGILINQDIGGFNNLDVHNVTVRNIYLRGIFTFSGTGFNIHDNTVQNVQGDNDVSIGIFNRNGSGTFANNHVSFTPDAISANHSSGTQFLNNIISNSLNGIHTDNAGDGGGVADLIQGNSVTNGVAGGQGSLWALAPVIAPVFHQNNVTNVEIGLAVYGQGAAVTTAFTDNTVDGAGFANSTGALVTTDELGFGSTNSSVLLTGNTIEGFTQGVSAVSQPGFTATVSAMANGIFSNGSGVTTSGAGSFSLSMTPNWWGTINGPANPTNTFNVGAQGNSVASGASFVPWLTAAPPSAVTFAPVTTSSPPGSYASIQAGVNASNSGGTVNAVAGTFTENVTVGTSVTIAGAGQASTKVIPALSSPNSCGGSLCPTASNIFLVQANNVTIHDLTADGDNPALTSGVVVGGADLDARNGIITDHTVGVFQNLIVHDVTVKNIFLRGVYASSGGSFDFNHDTVQNVQASPASIAMFNFGGSGVFANNTVSGANDAISANHSTGTQFLNNIVTASASGIHTDNAGDGGGSADVITGNSVTNGTAGSYGIWVFVPYIGPSFSNNTVTNVDVGIAAFGQGAAVTTTFADNDIDGASRPNSVGAFITTDQLGFGSQNSSVTLTGNTIKGFTEGIQADTQAGATATVNATKNAIFNNTSGVTKGGTGGSFSLNMTPNWWGDVTGPQHALNPAGLGNSVVDGVVYSPWIGIGTDASGSTGFQLTTPMTWIAGPAVCGATCIQAAIDDAANGDTVKAKTGVFNEHVNVNKQITLTAGSNPIIDGGGAGDGITISVPNVTVSSFEVRNVTNGVVIAAAANNATISTDNIHNFTSGAVRGSNATGASITSNTINGGHVGSCVGGFWGIQLQSVSGSVASNTVSGIGNGITNGCQEGRAIEADGTGTMAITNNTVSQYQKSGIIVRDTVAATVSGNTTTGEGPAATNAMNGITITSTATTSVTGNHTSANRYTPESDFSCGILYFPAGNPAPGALSVSGNDSTEDEVGVCLTNGSATAPVSGVSVTNNVINKHHQQAINIDSMTGVLVNGNQIDGQAGGTTATAGTTPDNDTRYYGIFAVDSTGTVSNNTIKGITHGPANGTQSGVGIRVTARAAKSANMTLSGNNISDIQKNAMVITNFYGGTGVNAAISGNTIAGNGPISYIAQNGIQVSNGATAQINANNISGYDYAPNTAAAIGILILQAGAVSATNNIVHNNMEGMYVQQTNGATVTGNTFTTTRDTAIFVFQSSAGTYTSNTMNGSAGSTGMYVYDGSSNNVVTANNFLANDYGVIVDYFGAAPLTNHFNNNFIVGNTIAGVQQLDTLVGAPVDAKDNWWGACSGPSGAGPGSGDAVSTNVTFTPFQHGACDTDGDLLTDDAETLVYGTDYQNPDTDADGCSDGREALLLNPSAGGDRDPLNYWDFYDVGTNRGGAGPGDENFTKDRKINFGDTLIILDHFGHDATDAHDHDLDRKITNPLKPWRTAEDSEPGNGDKVTFIDVLANLQSFGHDCTGNP